MIRMRSSVWLSVIVVVLTQLFVTQQPPCHLSKSLCGRNCYVLSYLSRLFFVPLVSNSEKIQ